jgi:hypothetical protein
MCRDYGREEQEIQKYDIKVIYYSSKRRIQ